MQFYIENHRNSDGKTSQLVYNSRNDMTEVPIKQGRLAAEAAGRIAKSLEKIGRDYNIDDEIINAPYFLDLSWCPLPLYRGLNKDRVDRITLPKYWIGGAGHEGSHMGHRRLLQHRMKGSQWAKEASIKELLEINKRNRAGVESFAAKYGGTQVMELATYGAVVIASAISAEKLIETLNDLARYAPKDYQDIALGASLLGIASWSIYNGSKHIAGHFQDKGKAKA